MKDGGASVLRRSLEQSRALLGTAFIFGMGMNLLYLAPSIYMMQVYDRVLTTGGYTTLWFVSAMLVAALCVLGWLQTERARLMTKVSLRLERLLAPALIAISMQRTGRAEDADRINLLREFDALRLALGGTAATALMDAPWAPIFVLVCAVMHPLLGLTVLFGGAVLVGIAYAADRSQLAAAAEISRVTPQIYAAQDAEGAAGATAQALGMRQALIERNQQRRTRLVRLQTLLAFRGAAFSAGTKTFRIALQSAVLALGACLAIQGLLSPGAMIAASILSARALAPLEQIIAAWRQIRQSYHAYQRIETALKEAPDTTRRTALPPPNGRLSFAQVVAQIPGVTNPVLHGISFELSPGEILGVIGPSGAGKSALARLAVGILAPSHGTVRIDGARLVDWDVDALGRHIGYLPQEVHLLAGTIAENIRRFAPVSQTDASMLDEATIDAARAAGAHEMILRLPRAYDTVLGFGGAGLSLGQAQRIALARALFGNPSLLVLDEPNAHLDPEGESMLTEALAAARDRAAAILVIAHRHRVLNVANRILLLADGRLRALGPRDQLLASMAATPSPTASPSLQEVMPHGS